MKTIIVLMAMCTSLLLNAQTNSIYKGIYFEQDLTWNQIKEKAKMENKYIFVDCFTTWCAPCKRMDVEIYPNEQVGQYINDKFISVKVQMDKTETDNKEVKKWYNDAFLLSANYNITSFPSYLFFDPDGKPVHKAIGYKKLEQFIEEGANALDPERQYYRALSNFKPGTIDTSELKGLAMSFRYSGPELAGKIAADYLNRVPKNQIQNDENVSFMGQFVESPEVQKIAVAYIKRLKPSRFKEKKNSLLISWYKANRDVQALVLNYFRRLTTKQLNDSATLVLLGYFTSRPEGKLIAESYIIGLSDKQLYTKSSIELLKQITKKTNDFGFKIFYGNGYRVDAVMNELGYAEACALKIFNSAEVDFFYKKAISGEYINWDSISGVYQKRYRKEFVEKCILNARVWSYKHLATTKNLYWPEYIRYNIEYIDRFGTDTSNTFSDATVLNNFVFDAIFMHSDDPTEINWALKIMEGVLRRNPTDANNTDTYAHLLYKAGQREQAIRWQEKALILCTENEDQKILYDDIHKNLLNMRNGNTTWVDKQQ